MNEFFDEVLSKTNCTINSTDAQKKFSLVTSIVTKLRGILTHGTSPEMKVENAYFCNKIYNFLERSSTIEKNNLLKEMKKISEESLNDFCRASLLCSRATIKYDEEKKMTNYIGNSYETCLLEITIFYLSEEGCDQNSLLSEFRKLHPVIFESLTSSESQIMETIHELPLQVQKNEKNNEKNDSDILLDTLLLIKGNVEKILEKCNFFYNEKGEKEKLTSKEKEKINQISIEFQKKGLRVIAIAQRIMSSKKAFSKGDKKIKYSIDSGSGSGISSSDNFNPNQKSKFETSLDYIGEGENIKNKNQENLKSNSNENELNKQKEVFFLKKDDNFDDNANDSTIKSYFSEMTLLGIVAIRDPIHENVKEAIQRMKNFQTLNKEKKKEKEKVNKIIDIKFNEICQLVIMSSGGSFPFLSSFAKEVGIISNENELKILSKKSDLENYVEESKKNNSINQIFNCIIVDRNLIRSPTNENKNNQNNNNVVEKDGNQIEKKNNEKKEEEKIDSKNIEIDVCKEINTNISKIITENNNSFLNNLKISYEELLKIIFSNQFVIIFGADYDTDSTIVKTLKSLNKVVAYFGDGINDKKSVDEANIIVARFKHSSEELVKRSDVLLMDDSFDSFLKALTFTKEKFSKNKKGGCLIQ